MKLFTAKAPSPFRVNVFLAEKGVDDLPMEWVDVMGGGTRTPDFLARNSLGETPVLELDDGSYLPESTAICRYLESLYPEKPLMGRDPLETAKINMWSRRMEQQIAGPISDVARHTFAFFADKMEQFPDYAASQARRQQERWAWLDKELSDGRTYLCDDAFSYADIMGMSALLICDFAEEKVPADLSHVKRWETAVRGRKSWGG